MTTARRFEDDPDLWGVVDAAGLNPKGRARNFTFDCPDCGRKGKASGRRDGPWHCFACEAKGNALTLARRFELAAGELHNRPASPPCTTNRNGVAPSTARAAWSALEVVREVYRDRLVAYLTGPRGWSASLAFAAAAWSGWAWIPDDGAELPHSLAWIARDPDRRAAFALRDERGEVWTLERRWTAPAPPIDPENNPKAKRLPTRGDEREAVAIFGRVPDAVAAAARGEPIYLCEGGPDTLAAAAVCRLDGRGAALGAHGHHGLPKVATALRAALEAAAVPATGVRVVCVPHLGDKPPPNAPPADKRGVGELSMAAAALALAGVSAVYIARPPVDAAGKGDLADAARQGVESVRLVFEAAELAHVAPVDLRDHEAADAAIGEAMLRALQAADGPNSLAVVIMPPGAGKTTGAFERAATVARQGRRVVFALPDHVNGAQKLAEFEAAFPGVPAVHVRGMPSLCELPARYPEKREAIARAAATMGRTMCAGCELASAADGTCEGWRVPKAREGGVTFAAHAGVASLARSMKPADLVIVDELPALVDMREVGPVHLRTMGGGGLAARPWYRDNPAHGDLAAELAAVADALDTETPRDLYAERLPFARVLEALRLRPVALEAAAGVLAELAYDPDPDRPPMPRPEDARRGAADRWPDAGAWTIVRDIARALSDPAHEPGLTCLKLDATGWTFESRRLYELPAGVRVLALDATGEIARAEWEALAARHGRTLVAVTLPAIGERPASADHYRTERLRTGRLWARNGRRVSFLADAPGAIRNALMRAAGAVPCVLGILTHKPLADALRWGANLVIDPDADPPKGAAFAADDVHALAVAELAAELVNRKWELEIGHFGRDDRASNAFGAVDVLAVLGPPRPDWGAIAEDAAALGVDPDGLGHARTMASTVQALARARHLRRPGVRLFLAADCDAPTGPELPGVAWTVENVDRSHAPTLAGLDAAKEIALWAERAGCLDVPAVLAVLAPHVVGPKVAARLCRVEAERRGWVGARVGPGGRRVYVHRENLNEIEAMAAHGGIAFALRGQGPPEVIARGELPKLLDPMIGDRPGIVGDSPVHAAQDDGKRAASRPSGGGRPGTRADGPPPFDPPDNWSERGDYAGPPLDDVDADRPTPEDVDQWARMRAAG